MNRVATRWARLVHPGPIAVFAVPAQDDRLSANRDEI